MPTISPLASLTTGPPLLPLFTAASTVMASALLWEWLYVITSMRDTTPCVTALAA